MKDLDINFPLDKFEKLIIDIGWKSLDDWFNFWNNQRNILSIDQYWNNKVNDDWIWGLALPLLSQAYKFQNNYSERKIIGISALPGTGKTLLSKAVAGEAEVPFFIISGSEFVELFVGAGAARVRVLFEQAMKIAPCIIFIDELDAIGKSRSGSMGVVGGNDEREQTLNQLLTEMDGFASTDKPVIVLAATNQPEVLDAALLRPGRFDRQVLVDRPDLSGRKTILEIYTKKVKLADSIDLDSIAQATSGFAGADLANMVNEAACLLQELKEKVLNSKI